MNDSLLLFLSFGGGTGCFEWAHCKISVIFCRNLRFWAEHRYRESSQLTHLSRTHCAILCFLFPPAAPLKFTATRCQLRNLPSTSAALPHQRGKIYFNFFNKIQSVSPDFALKIEYFSLIWMVRPIISRSGNAGIRQPWSNGLILWTLGNSLNFLSWSMF